MSRNLKLNDLQLVLLSTAAQRNDGSVFPPAESIANEEDRIRKVIPPLLTRGLIQEVPVKRGAGDWREEGEQPIGLRLTDTGRAAIAPEEGDPKSAADRTKAAAAAPAKISPAPRRGSKTEVVLGLLRRPEGATIGEIVEATAWLPHTTRAALTGLRKKGHHVEKSKRHGATCYRVVVAA